MGLCNQIHDNVPERWTHNSDKYLFSHNQMELIRMHDRLLLNDVKDITSEWKMTEAICDCMDLITEIEEMKRYGHASKARWPS